MANLKSLGKNLRKRVGSIGARGSNGSVAVATVVLEALTEGTPADTSQAVSNWQVGIGVPQAPRILPHVAGIRGSTAAASAKVANTIGIAKMKRKKPGEDIIISNSLDYILGLDTGEESPQNPGFVGRAVDKGRAVAKVVSRRPGG